LIEALVRRLGARATLKLFQDADHSFHVPAKSGRTDDEMRAEMLNEVSAWLDTIPV
jgi:dienelactone hydrolase